MLGDLGISLGTLRVTGPAQEVKPLAAKIVDVQAAGVNSMSQHDCDAPRLDLLSE